MSLVNSRFTIFEAYFSSFKVIFCFLSLLILGIVPLIPREPTYLSYTGFLFTPAFSLVRILSSFIILVISSVLIFPLLGSLSRAPALRITEETIEIYTTRKKVIHKNKIDSMAADIFGWLVIKYDGKKVVIPLKLYRNSGDVKKVLMKLWGELR